MNPNFAAGYAPTIGQLMFGAAGAMAVALLSWRLRLLTPGGTCVQFLMGCVLFGIGGWPAALPIIVFFATASAATKFADTRRKVLTMEGRTSARDAVQVLANGGIASCLVLLSLVVRDPRIYYAYVGAVAAAAADTLATEIGTVYGRRPRSITTFRPAAGGSSGAVTLAGFAGAFGGAAMVSLASIPWGTGAAPMIVAGVGGCVLDSILGASVQARFECRVCGQDTESVVHCEETTKHRSGLRVLTNDGVNFVCTAVGAACASLIA